MTLAASLPQSSFTGNGTTTVFPLGFYAEFRQQLNVTVDGVASSAWTFAEGQVTFTTAPASGALIVIQRRTVAAMLESLGRTENYSATGVVTPSVLDSEMDRVWMGLQDQAQRSTDLHDVVIDHEYRMAQTDADRQSAALSAASAASDALAANAAKAAAAASATSVADSAAAIAANTSAINSHSVTLSSHTTAINSNTAAITANNSAISSNTAAIATIAGGQRPFATLAALTAYAGGDKASFVAMVTNDAISANNGLYSWNGTAWVLSAYDPKTQLLNQVQPTLTTVSPLTVATGYYTGASGTSIISDANTAYGWYAPKNGLLVSFRSQLAGGTATVRLQQYRRSQRALVLISTQDVSLPYPASSATLATPLSVKKGDLIMLAYVSGAAVRGLSVGSGDPLGAFTAATVTTTIGATATIGRSRNSPEFEYTLQYSSNIQSIAQTATNSAVVSASTSSNALTLGADPVKFESTFVQGALYSGAATSAGISSAYGGTDTAAYNGRLTQVRALTKVISAMVDLNLIVLNPANSGTYTVSQIVPVSAMTDGTGMLVATDADFGAVYVQKGGLVLAIGTNVIDVPLQNNTITGPYAYLAVGSIVLGAEVTVGTQPSGNPFSLEMTYVRSSLDVSNRLTTLEKATTIGSVGSQTFIAERFTAVGMPIGWTESGGWSVSNGLQSPGTGSWTTTVLSPGYSALANRAYRARIVVNDLASVFGLCTAPIEAGSGSCVAMVNGTTNKLGIYLWEGGASAGALAAEVVIPFSLTANRAYNLIVEKLGYYSTVKFVDTVTQQSVQLAYSGTTNYAQFHGRAGVMFVSGNILVREFYFLALYPKKCQMIIVGDSNAERAATVLPNATWAFKLAAMRQLNGDVIVSARAGDETPNFLLRKNYDLLQWQPKYVLLALGTNDTSQATWRTNMAQNIADIVALGAEPILITQIPRTASQALRTAMNDDIRNGYFGTYRYIDFATAVSLNADGVTWDPAYNSGDATHVNPAGQDRLLAQVLIDAPFVIR